MDYDPSAAIGVPAHVTILFPFVAPDQLHARRLAEVAEVCAAHRSFRFRLVEARRFGNEVLYLAPEPAEPFAGLTRALESAFGLRAYGGAVDEPIPHLTIADGQPPERMSAIAAAVAPGLPIESTALAVELYLLGDDGRWRPAHGFRLRGS